MVGNTNNLAGQGAEGRLERKMVSAPHCTSYFQYSFPKPSWLLHNVHPPTYWPPLASPQPNLPSETDWTQQTFLLSASSMTLFMSWWALEDGTNTLSQNLKNKVRINTTKLRGRAKTSTTPCSKPQISTSSSYTSKFNMY
jgi:hypothetical protein